MDFSWFLMFLGGFRNKCVGSLARDSEESKLVQLRLCFYQLFDFTWEIRNQCFQKVISSKKTN